MKFENKNDFRIECKRKLKKVAYQNRIKKDTLVNQDILNYIDEIKAKNILLYLPLKEEINIWKVLLKLRKEKGFTIFVPFMEGVSFKMVKFRLPLFRKRFNILEPKNSYARGKKIDLAIVPVLGVDGAFKRVGFGKGMYDRFFESLGYKPKIAFVELVKCFTSSHVGEIHDIQADIYITPHIICRRGKK
ncbi:MAG: 5-formyltetrahydrofolate cyclo-ligase [Epsilonproteobacteria bacterium]|nr:5-formyltetrahydrofolate cyclo-ligase [Campylobacterota bacterium]